tara:strand:- start:2148 stop:2798 length:651 start_codon:yes stop_codon:yes gene_type:complete
MPTSAQACPRCDSLRFALDRTETQRDEHEHASRELQARLLSQKHSLQVATAALAELQDRLTAQEEARRRAEQEAVACAEQNATLAAQLEASRERERGLEMELQQSQALEVTLQKRLVRAAARLVEQSRTQDAMEQHLADTSRTLGGAARFWAAAYENAAPALEAPRLEDVDATPPEAPAPRLRRDARLAAARQAWPSRPRGPVSSRGAFDEQWTAS